MTRNVEELKREIEERRSDLFKNGEIVDKMKEKAFYVPFMAMGSSLMTLYIGKRLIQAKVDNPLKRPLLFQFGNNSVDQCLLYYLTILIYCSALI